MSLPFSKAWTFVAFCLSFLYPSRGYSAENLISCPKFKHERLLPQFLIHFNTLALLRKSSFFSSIIKDLTWHYSKCPYFSNWKYTLFYAERRERSGFL